MSRDTRIVPRELLEALRLHRPVTAGQFMKAAWPELSRSQRYMRLDLCERQGLITMEQAGSRSAMGCGPDCPPQDHRHVKGTTALFELAYDPTVTCVSYRAARGREAASKRVGRLS